MTMSTRDVVAALGVQIAETMAERDMALARVAQLEQQIAASAAADDAADDAADAAGADS